ncbi:hypothetical protein HYV11_00175 [Candidatus Dependentiae bacterium]|nr:hypothetical protein [Candidatus Dependentiae bacterium]
MTTQNNIFKNSGIRDKAPKNINLLDRLINIFYRPQKSFITFNNITTLGYAIAAYLHKKNNQPCNIIIGTDTRPSRAWIKKQLTYGLINSGHHIFDAEIVPTPFIAKAVKDYQDNEKKICFQLGIIITASHNPAAYNGIKIVTPTGYLTIEDEIIISSFFHIFTTDIASLIEFDQFDKGTLHSFDLFSFYKNEILKEIPHLNLSTIKMVVDCANGATYQVAEKLFQLYGISTILVNNSNDGRRINLQSGCADPQLLVQAIHHYQTEWGCAFDGDGDRVIIADNKGNIFDGDDILLILSQHPDFCDEKTIISTIMCNQAIENYFNEHHKTLLRTDVGERNIIDQLKKHQAKLGSEPCGHITITDHTFCSDGIFTTLKFFETLYQYKINNMKLCQKFPQIQETINLENQTIEDAKIQGITESLKQTIIPGRVIVRKSNTEPLLRLMIEHPNKIFAQQIMNELKNRLQS